MASASYSRAQIWLHWLVAALHTVLVLRDHVLRKNGALLKMMRPDN